MNELNSLFQFKKCENKFIFNILKKKLVFIRLHLIITFHLNYKKLHNT